MKRRYIISKGGKTIGGVEVTHAQRLKLEARGYHLLAA